MRFNKQLVTPCAWSVAAGVVAGMIIMPFVFGYMGPNDAKKMASDQSDKAVVAALAPECAVQFRQLPDFAAKKAVLIANKDDSWKMRDAFPAKLVTVPGQSYPNSDLANACAALVLTPGKTAQAQ